MFVRIRALLIVIVLCAAPTLGYAQDVELTAPVTSCSLLTDDEIRSLAAQRKVQVADDAIAEMRRTLDDGLDRLERTRNEERDVLKLNCINEKVTAVKGFLKVAEKARVDLDDAVAQNDDEEQVHQTKLVLLAASRVCGLGNDTEACFGDLPGYTGPTRLGVDVAQDVRTDNPERVIEIDDISIGVLPDLSPIQ